MPKAANNYGRIQLHLKMTFEQSLEEGSIKNSKLIHTKMEQKHLGRIENKKMTDLNTIISIFTLNKNGLNIPNKRHILYDWIKKEKQHLFKYYRQ